MVTPRELKNESPAPQTRQELLLVLALTTILLVIANLIAAVVLDRWSPNFGYVVINAKWNKLVALDKPVDWLVLGDSSANQGIDPRVLERRLGGRAINLATIADMLAVNDAWMLERYVSQFGPPRAVVLGHVYDVWERKLLDPLIAEVPLPWGYWRSMNPPVEVGMKRALKLAELRYVPLYSRQESLLMLLRGWVNPLAFPSIREDGFMEVPEPDPLQVSRDMQEHLEATRGRKFTMSDDNQRALMEIRELANHYDFEVILAGAPLYDALYQRATFRSYYDDVADALNQWVQPNPHWHYVFRQPMLFPRRMMQNVDHLTVQGAQDYSANLADAIASLGSTDPETAQPAPEDVHRRAGSGKTANPRRIHARFRRD